MNVAETLTWGRKRLKSQADEYRLDALVLLSAAVERPKEWLFAHEDYILSHEEAGKYDGFIQRRIDGLPVQYIINYCEFMGLGFYVDENVLIPRADSELLVELVIKEAEKRANAQILDMCTGSGCIGISAAYNNTDCAVTAIDICPKALAVAKKNAEVVGVSERMRFYESDLFEIFEKNVQIHNVFDIIDANPPYISKAEMYTLQKEVCREPYKALCGGEKGVEFYEEIADKGRKHLKEGGELIFEIGCTQAEAVSEIMYKYGFRNINIYKDLSGLDRVVKGEYRCSTG